MRKLTMLAPLAVAAVALSACSSAAVGTTGATSASTTASTSAASACGTTVPEIAAAAKKEGAVDLIALPDTWANYGGILDAFRKKYGITATVANPDASSADEITAIKTLRGQPGMPEVVDVGQAQAESMLALGRRALIDCGSTDQQLVQALRQRYSASVAENLRHEYDQVIADAQTIVDACSTTTTSPAPAPSR